MYSVQIKDRVSKAWLTVGTPFQSLQSAELFLVLSPFEARIVPFVCAHPSYNAHKCTECGLPCTHDGGWDRDGGVQFCVDCGYRDEREPDYMDIAHRHAEDEL